MPGPHLYRRPESTVWWASFTVPGRKSQRVSTGKRDQGEAAEAAAAAYLEACHRARVPVPAGTSVPIADLVALYLDDLRGRIERRELVRGPTFAADAEKALHRLLERFGDVGEVQQGWPEALAAWHAEASWRTLQIVTVAARAFLRWAHRGGHLPAAPVLEAPTTEEATAEAKERRPLTEQQREAFLRVVKKADARAWRIYTAAFFSGARKSDLERLVWRQVDFAGGWLHFPARQTKSRKRDQVVGLHSRAAAALKAEKRAQGKIDPAGLVFGPFDFHHEFPAWAKAAGIVDLDGLTAHHVTRHTTATLAGDEGATLAELMALGRWTTPQMAARYMKVAARHSKTALERL